MQRAQRLSQARDALLTTNSCATTASSIETDDIEIYVRWLICHFYSQKTFLQSIKILQWLPHEFHIESLIEQTTTSHNDSSNENRSIRENERNFSEFTSSTLTSAKNFQRDNSNVGGAAAASSNIFNTLADNFKFLDNIYQPSTTTVPFKDKILYSIDHRKQNFFKRATILHCYFYYYY
jgi:hypothetical protein